MKIVFLLLTLSLASCTYFISKIGGSKYDVVNLDKKSLKIVFSHNINGETHPCGCRHNPLGGLPQVAGAIHEMKADSDILYVDTGDTFFPSAKFPSSVSQSLNHTANTLVDALKKLDLRYFVPGDQDFANDMSFLNKLNEQEKFTFLISNLSEDSKLKHKTFSVYKKGPHQIFLMGVVDPSILSERKHKSNFISPSIGIDNTLKEVVKAGYDKANPFHRLILLSHSGLEADEKIANEFKNFDWIIGAHTQSFTRYPVKEGKTSPVQVLSRNHYLGEITIDLTKDRKADTFKILEMRDEQKDKLKPNPFISLISGHKEQLKVVQTKEQNEQLNIEINNSGKIISYNTASSCIECHSEQGKFWQGTAHSIAFGTLIRSNEEKNLTCIQCHTYGLRDPKAFSTSSNIVKVNLERFNNENIEAIVDEAKKAAKVKVLQAKHTHLKNNYWKDVKKIFNNKKAIRSMEKDEVRKIAAEWQEIDDKHSISHNFANVQCLNCHNKHEDHPFTNLAKQSGEQKYRSMKSKCLKCHNSDQSPEWYNDKDSGKNGTIKELVIIKKMQQVACPKLEK